VRRQEEVPLQRQEEEEEEEEEEVLEDHVLSVCYLKRLQLLQRRLLQLRGGWKGQTQASQLHQSLPYGQVFEKHLRLRLQCN
jgi:hypothetical protein